MLYDNPCVLDDGLQAMCWLTAVCACTVGAVCVCLGDRLSCTVGMQYFIVTADAVCV